MPPIVTQHPKQIWEAVLGELQLQVTRPSYETWLKDTVGIEYRDGSFVVGTPSTFVSEMLEHRMYSLISHATEKVTKASVEISFLVTQKDIHHTPQAAPLPANDDLERITTQPMQESEPRHFPAYRLNHLNPKYTFNSFIVGKSNELAHAAAVAVSNNPGLVYNPLLIYSDVGLGKTHLLHAIGHQILSRGLSLIYTTTEEFTNQYIKSIREGKTEEFRNYYRGTDVLLLDDIQFLIGKEQTQEGFFHTFNTLHMTNRQIVITSDRPLTGLTLLEDRVRSRLGGGLVVDSQPPDLETRLAILRAKVDQMARPLNDEVLQFIGLRGHRNVRELEGSLNRVIVYAHLAKTPITLDLAKQALTDIHPPTKNLRSSPEAIIQAVSKHFRVDEAALKGPRGKKSVSQARQIAMYLLKEEAALGPTAIGRIVGGKDHSTVVKNCASIARRLCAEPHLSNELVTIRNSLSFT